MQTALFDPPPPLAVLSTLDPLLRGQYTSPDALESGAEPPPLARILRVALVLGALYGASMGLYALTTKSGGDGWLQALASAVKVPLLVLATVAVTFPSLYAVSALARSRLDMAATLRLVLLACAIHLVLLASLAPIVAFFTLSTTSYGFMRLLNAAFFAAAGVVGLRMLLTSLRPLLTDPEEASPAPPQVDVSVLDWPPAEEDAAPTVESSPPPRPQRPDPRTERSLTVVRAWVVLFALVGAQMGWILRPFIGDPDEPFVLFGERSGSFLAGIVEALNSTFGG